MPSAPAHGDDLAALFDRLPAELLQCQQDIADAAGLVVARGAVIGRACRRAFRARCRSASARAASRPLASGRRADRGFRSADPPRRTPVRVLMAARLADRLRSATCIFHGHRQVWLMTSVCAIRPNRPPRPSTARWRRWRRSRRAGCAGRARSRRPPGGRGSRRARHRRTRLRGRSAARRARMRRQRPRAAGSPPSSSAKNSARPFGQSRSSASSFTGSASSGSAVRAHCSAASVTMRARAFEVELVGHAAPGEHRLDRPHAEFGGLFEHQVEAVLLEQRGAQPEIGHLFARAQLSRPGRARTSRLPAATTRAAHSPVVSSHSTTASPSPTRMTLAR